jgi:hypothetical protein
MRAARPGWASFDTPSVSHDATLSGWCPYAGANPGSGAA